MKVHPCRPGAPRNTWWLSRRRSKPAAPSERPPRLHVEPPPGPAGALGAVGGGWPEPQPVDVTSLTASSRRELGCATQSCFLSHEKVAENYSQGPFKNQHFTLFFFFFFGLPGQLTRRIEWIWLFHLVLRELNLKKKNRKFNRKPKPTPSTIHNKAFLEVLWCVSSDTGIHHGPCRDPRRGHLQAPL